MTRLAAGVAASVVQFLRRDRRLPPAVIVLLLGAGAAAVVLTAALPEGASVRALLAVVLAVLLAFACVWAPRQGILLTLGWLAIVGGLRRVVTTFQADPGRDPLLLVGPVAIVVLVAIAVARGGLMRRRWLAHAMLVFGAVILLWALHPDHESVEVGLGGLLFWLVPIMWFFVGRGIVDSSLARRILVFGAGIALASACYGLWQVIVGFPSWDWDYIFTRGRFNSLYVGPDTFRPFAAFTSANEYALTTACGVLVFTLVCARGVIRGRRRDVAVGVVGAGICAAALALSSVRAPAIFLVLAFGVVAVVRFRRRAVPLLAAGAVLVLLTGAVFSQIDPDSLSESGPQRLVRHAVAGLGHPFDRERSTLGLHLGSLERGVKRGFSDPLGDGTGSTTTAALRLGNGTKGSEWDLSDGGIAFGIVGLALVAFISVAAFARVAGRAWRTPGLVHLGTLGIMVILLRHWWTGGHYFLAPFLWVLVGSVDAPVRRPVRTRAVV